MCCECGRLENKIIQMFMRNRTVVSPETVIDKEVTGTRVTPQRYPRFAYPRRGLLRNRMDLHTVQYPFVSTAAEKVVIYVA